MDLVYWVFQMLGVAIDNAIAGSRIKVCRDDPSRLTMIWACTVRILYPTLDCTRIVQGVQLRGLVYWLDVFLSSLNHFHHFHHFHQGTWSRPGKAASCTLLIGQAIHQHSD